MTAFQLFFLPATMYLLYVLVLHLWCKVMKGYKWVICQQDALMDKLNKKLNNSSLLNDDQMELMDALKDAVSLETVARFCIEHPIAGSLQENAPDVELQQHLQTELILEDILSDHSCLQW
ncbi:uncharacterized protein BT62DRAFT_924110 [Guyanagaster necrorhizus]|uniref:Uncharacterized protein n=1 Tax=Guyanagaster necrorhizus TaxID=856835 RepID=A0A9P7VI22_9AGAR|nr:uncharacterized protein BT62DRAFT_924110 [Guyanagaster necrorhizus MCA 3950]KAG7440324.1 hypothetical protein BT62DRAFT_924110 [Guyanagaster necrorhizus MCA 3950]